MTSLDQLPAKARAVIDANRYMVLSTADRTGRPWVSPVYFERDGYGDLYWVSSPNARHSRNLAERPEVGIVVFDSSVIVGSAQAVYMSAVATQVPDEELAERAEVFRTPRFADVRYFDVAELSGDGDIRLFHAEVEEHSILVAGRDPDLGRGVDSRYPVDLGG